MLEGCAPTAVFLNSEATGFTRADAQREAAPALRRRFLVEEFKEGVDALHQLAADLRASSLDQVHRDASLGAVGEANLGVIDGRDLGGCEDSHPVDERAALSSTLDQFELAHCPGDLLAHADRTDELPYSIYGWRF